MIVSIHGRAELHRASRPDEDRRLAWTVCGIRFAWGRLGPWHDRPAAKCPTCFPVA